MEIVMLSHGLKMGGAQESTLDTVKYFVELGIKVNAILCKQADINFITSLRELKINLSYVDCDKIKKYPYIKRFSKTAEEYIRSSDLVWISDEFYLSAVQLKRLFKKPVVAHLRSYALLCPKWNLLTGLNEVCNNKCSIEKIVKCRIRSRLDLWKLAKEYKSKIKKANLLIVYIDLIKGIHDYLKWPIQSFNVIDNIDGFIAVSKFIKEIHEYSNPIFKEKDLVTIYNPIDINYKINNHHNVYDKYSNDNIYVIYASGSSLMKGSHILLYVAKIALEEGLKNLKFYLFGAKHSLLLEKMIKKLGLNSNVRLLPRVKRDLLHRFIGCYGRVVLMPSVWPEPFGRIPVEANKLGVPAVVSNRGGLPETIEEGITGYISDPTPYSLYKALIKVIEKKWNKQHITSATTKKFDSLKSVYEMLNFFNKFI